MNKYKVWFYTKHNPEMQLDTVNAFTEEQARAIFILNACEVVSIDLLLTELTVEIGDPLLTDLTSNTDEVSAEDYKNDSLELRDLYVMGMGG